jgi:hypothetical protein
VHIAVCDYHALFRRDLIMEFEDGDDNRQFAR